MSEKSFLSYLLFVLTSLFTMACQHEELNEQPPSDSNIHINGENGESGEKGNNGSSEGNGETKTLVVYYSYTNNTEQIINDLKALINADIIEVEPVEKGLNYAANNYAIGTEQLNKIKNNPNSESSYPAIDSVKVDMSKYNTVIIATPLWWSQMASNMQTFLFKYGKEMADKNVGLIVSSHSSGISGVETDAKRLVPNGKFFTKSLWINASQHSQRKSLLEQWLKDIDYTNLSSNITSTMNLKVNNQTVKVNLTKNAATEALLTLLKNGPITYTANDYGGFEKVGALGFSLPSSDTDITTEAGDIMLYTNNQLCIFFDSNSWQYTRIGKIEGMTKDQLKNTFGDGQVNITLSL